jgi:hypothetical protein
MVARYLSTKQIMSSMIFTNIGIQILRNPIVAFTALLLWLKLEAPRSL